MSDYSFLTQLSSSVQAMPSGTHIQSVWDENNDKLITFFSTAGDDAIKYQIGTVNADTGAITYGSTLSQSVTSLDFIGNAHWNPATSTGIVVFNDTSSDIFAKAFTSDGTTLTWGATVTVSTAANAGNQTDLIFNSNANSYIVVYPDGLSSNGFIAGVGLTLSGTAITAGGITNLGDNGTTNHYNISSYWDTDNQRGVIFYVLHVGSTIYASLVSMSDTTLTRVAHNVPITTDYDSASAGSGSGFAVYVPDVQRGVIAYPTTVGDLDMRYITTSTTTITPSSAKDMEPSQTSDYGILAILDPVSQLVYYILSGNIGGNDTAGYTSGVDVSSNTAPVCHIHGSEIADIPYTVSNYSVLNGNIIQINSTQYVVSSRFNSGTELGCVVFEKITPQPTPSRLTSYLVRYES